MGGFFSMEQNVRNTASAGAKAPRLNGRNSVNVEAPNNTRRNNSAARNNSRRNGNNGSSNGRPNNVAINMGSVGTTDPEELEEVVVNSRPNSPPNTRININRRNNNNGRINVVATNEQAPLPLNNTPEGEEQVGGKRRRRKSRSRSKRKSRRTHRK